MKANTDRICSTMNTKIVFVAFFSESFLCIQIKLALFSPGIVSALEKRNY